MRTKSNHSQSSEIDYRGLCDESALAIGSIFLPRQQTRIMRLDGSGISPPEVDAAVMQRMEAAHVTGVGIAVFNRGEVAYIKTYRARDTENRLPLTSDSVMTAASLTKPVFHAAGMGGV